MSFINLSDRFLHSSTAWVLTWEK